MIRKESLQSAQVHWPRLLLVAVAILLPACSDSLEDHPPLYPVKGETIARLPGGLSEQIAIKGRSSW